jgi:hypothetical protein
MTKHENHLKNFLAEPETIKIITDCELLFAGYQMIEMFKISVREVGSNRKEPEIQITISSNVNNGISEYTRTYKYNG